MNGNRYIQLIALGRMLNKAFRGKYALAIVTVLSSLTVWSLVPIKAMAATVTYQIVTNEINARQPDGSHIEAYRFDPAIFPVQLGDDVVLQIRGLKGHDHPIVLEGYNLQGVVRRNQVTTLQFKATKPGVFKLVCTSHADAAHEGPMEGYVIVIAPTKHR